MNRIVFSLVHLRRLMPFIVEHSQNKWPSAPPRVRVLVFEEYMNSRPLGPALPYSSWNLISMFPILAVAQFELLPLVRESDYILDEMLCFVSVFMKKKLFL
jgi:hypothetical protein